MRWLGRPFGSAVSVRAAVENGVFYFGYWFWFYYEPTKP